MPPQMMQAMYPGMPLGGPMPGPMQMGPMPAGMRPAMPGVMPGAPMQGYPQMGYGMPMYPMPMMMPGNGVMQPAGMTMPPLPTSPPTSSPIVVSAPTTGGNTSALASMGVLASALPAASAATPAASTASASDDWKAGLVAPPVDKRIKTTDVTATKGTTFEDQKLKRDLLKGIYELGWERPSPIQEETLPAILGGFDVMARGKNGTGKTAAYLIPVCEMVDASKNAVQGASFS